MWAVTKVIWRISLLDMVPFKDDFSRVKLEQQQMRICSSGAFTAYHIYTEYTVRENAVYKKVYRYSICQVARGEAPSFNQASSYRIGMAVAAAAGTGTAAAALSPWQLQGCRRQRGPHAAAAKEERGGTPL